MCTTGPLVTGVDATQLRTQFPGAFQIIQGDLLLRAHAGGVEPIAFTQGYTTSAFSPSS